MISPSARNAAAACVREFRPPTVAGFHPRPPVPDLLSAGQMARVLESKSHPADAVLLRAAACQRLHWLISRQISFRRREIR